MCTECGAQADELTRATLSDDWLCKACLDTEWCDYDSYDSFDDDDFDEEFYDDNYKHK